MIEPNATKTVARATVFIAIILGGAALFVANEFFIPIALGLVLASLLWPVLLRLERWGIPTAFGAALCILATVALFVAAIASFEPPVRRFVDEIPKSIAAVRPRLLSMSASVTNMLGAPAKKAAPPAPKKSADTLKSAQSAKSSDTIAKSTADTGVRSKDTLSSAQSDTVAHVVADSITVKAKAPTPKGANTSPNLDLSAISSGAPSTISHALGIASGLLGDFVEIVLFAMFVLAAGHAWQAKLGSAVSSASMQKTVADTVGEMRGVVSQYVFMTTLINAGQATIIGLLLKLLGYPSPLLWGVLTFALEFIPYFGGLVMVALLFVVGLAGGREFLPALYGPGVYLLVTSLQNNVLSPIVYGRGMRLNPTAILAGLMLWYMLWGVAGAFLAVPILAAFNVLAGRVPALRGVHEFLSD